MMFWPSILVVMLSPLVSCHFSIVYPPWRGESELVDKSIFVAADNWLCGTPGGNVSQTESANNRTLWPLDGGPLAVHFGHPYGVTYVNLGLGDNVTVFNISLVQPFNETGNGSFCFPKVNVPSDLGLKEGTNASIQVIQLGARGAAFYNCADITFSSNASEPPVALCTNGTGVSGQSFGACRSSNSASTGSATGSAATASSTSGASPALMDTFTLVWTAGLFLGLCGVLL